MHPDADEVEDLHVRLMHEAAIANIQLKEQIVELSEQIEAIQAAVAMSPLPSAHEGGVLPMVVLQGAHFEPPKRKTKVNEIPAVGGLVSSVPRGTKCKLALCHACLAFEQALKQKHRYWSAKEHSRELCIHDCWTFSRVKMTLLRVLTVETHPR